MTATRPGGRRVGEQRPGGRAERVRSAVLDATAELLEEVGYDRFGIDDVATRAGVHKTTVYRRWPTKPELVADAVQAHSEVHVPIPDTGDVHADLQALARSVVANIGSVGGARRSRSIVAAAAHSEELAASLRAFWSDRLGAAVPIVERAVARGDLPPDTDPILLIETLVGPIWLRLLMTGEPIDDGLADRVTELVLTGAAP
ncbi:MAG: TetR/AcrR family transcriptional regulator [Ilumatobacter sp.]|uniref:TetR/AcrR family transcriptional regulator n=1 Tax=Ilumatobacter sp. TaxID=1967498 RepID=UPI00261856C2|nr:TetR/AcrR family transcriptional regulator [Ilumatobacter sp.]MDJ0767935.1 TetR/AcrR family transcriptional regulator [Ilumatobacter sp.]